jgi:hypothetical protein
MKRNDVMKITFVRKLLTFGVFISILIGGCSNTEQTPTTPILGSPVVEPSVTAILTSEITISPTFSTPEVTPTTTTLSSQANLVSTTDRASFVSETYPDNSVLKPGESFVKIFEIKNVGASTWTTSYALFLDSAPQNETLGSPTQIQFPQETPPGKNLSIQLSLVAPATTGTYTVYWALKNDRGETIPVDGSNNVWAKIMICDPSQPCNPPATGGGAAAGSVSATLTNFSSGAQSAVASFCMTFPNRNYGPAPGTVSLILDQRTISASAGGSQGVGCFEFEFPVTATQIQGAASIAVSIAQVRIIGGPNDPDGTCQAVHPNLMAQYPGLDFQCQFSMAGYYTNLQVSAGMTTEQAKQVIFDAIEGAINGPWLLTVR